MSHATFVAAAFGITGIAMIWLIISSWIAMKKSEALADDLRREG